MSLDGEILPQIDAPRMPSESEVSWVWETPTTATYLDALIASLAGKFVLMDRCA
jgi:hypothetical protein